MVAIVLLLLAWRFEKYFALLYYRMQPIPVAPASTPPSASRAIVVAFGEASSASNRFYSTDGGAWSVWESHDPHRLRISFGADAPTFELESFNTLIDYKDGRLNWMKFYPFLPPVSYDIALSSLKKLFSTYGIQDRVRWNEYDARLDARADGTETYLPTIEFAAASLTIYLNCGWDDYELARAQIRQVKCGPHLVLAAKSQGAAPLQATP